MTDIVDEGYAWPVNSSGEIVVSAGVGSTDVVGYLPTGMIPVAQDGGLAIRLPDSPPYILEGDWTPITLENDWVATVGFAAPAYRVVGNSVYINLVVEAGTGNIATLPLNIRPSSTIAVGVFGDDIGGDTLFRLHIASDGAVTIGNAVTDGNQSIYAHFAYSLGLPEVIT